MNGHLVLAGGGHSHALLLKIWAMSPSRRPRGLITLVSRYSTTLYSGMVPGFIAGLYCRDDLEIDLRRLADQAGVAIIISEIRGLNPSKRQLLLLDRPALTYEQLSLNVGSISPTLRTGPSKQIAIKPLEPALTSIQQVEIEPPTAPLEIVGSGLAAIELSLALRHRWPNRTLNLKAKMSLIPLPFVKALDLAGVNATARSTDNAPTFTKDDSQGFSLNCTGSRAPSWLKESGLPVDERGRVRTEATLEVLGHPGHFATGDCAVIDSDPRAPTGVWAVLAAAPLARNLEANCKERPLSPCRFKHRALQLVGGFDTSGAPIAWAMWGSLLLGPHPWLWALKKRIDRKFMAQFKGINMDVKRDTEQLMLCRGCAAKLPAEILGTALEDAGFINLGKTPEDAAQLPDALSSNNQPLLQSIDGFPALISDPWLNAKLTALHACSDLWACGARVRSAQAIVTLPLAPPPLQQKLLGQTLAGLRSVLEIQGAELIGGHTLEARSPTEGTMSMGVQVALCVQGETDGLIWRKRGIQAGDQLLIGGLLGTGVLFAASMKGEACPHDLDRALEQMTESQHERVALLRELERKYPGQLHAATDVTGFGLLGHLTEMLVKSSEDEPTMQVLLHAEELPALKGAIELLEAGHASSLAPANRRAWSSLDPHLNLNSMRPVHLNLGTITAGSRRHHALLELLVDPQTSGPLLIAVGPNMAEALLEMEGTNRWWKIGSAITPLISI